jgi:hypothetical protein
MTIKKSFMLVLCIMLVGQSSLLSMYRSGLSGRSFSDALPVSRPVANPAGAEFARNAELQSRVNQGKLADLFARERIVQSSATPWTKQKMYAGGAFGGTRPNLFRATPSLFMSRADAATVLGVSSKASEQEIKAAYRAMVKKYHPDVAGVGSTEKMKQISEAYKILSNKGRATYDWEQDSEEEWEQDSEEREKERKDWQKKYEANQQRYEANQQANEQYAKTVRALNKMGAGIVGVGGSLILGSDLYGLYKKNTDLMYVIDQQGSLQQCEKLIKSGVNLNQQNQNGETALMRAVRFDRKDVVGALLKAGADTAIVNNQGQTALSIASENNHIVISGMLLKNKLFGGK